MQNSRKYRNHIPILSLAQCVVLAIFFSAFGLSYVFVKVQQSHRIASIKTKDTYFRKLQEDNAILRTRLAYHSSIAFLQAQYDRGEIHLRPLAEKQIIRIPFSTASTVADTGHRRP
jgi:hypothetical protein